MRGLVTVGLVASATAKSLGEGPVRSSRILQSSRTVFGGTPLSLNTTTFQYFLDPSISLSPDFDFARLDTTVAAVETWQLPIFLQLGILGGKSCPPQNASDVPGTDIPSVTNFDGCSTCFDYDIYRNPVASFIRQAYVNYALAVTLAFNGTNALGLLNFGIDANKYLEDNCPASNWESYIEFVNQVYDTVKTAFPALGMFPSFSLETMMQISDNMACKGASGNAQKMAACTKAGYAALAGIQHDAMAFSAYPSVSQISNGPFQPWYITLPLSVMNKSDSESFVVAGTGLLSSDMVINFGNGTEPLSTAAAPMSAVTPAVNPLLDAARSTAVGSSRNLQALDCQTLIESNSTLAAQWFEMLLSSSSQYGFPILVNFAYARDTLFDQALTSCPCTAPLPILQPYCDYMSAFRSYCIQTGLPPYACEASVKVSGTLGIRDLFAQPREPLYSAVQAKRT